MKINKKFIIWDIIPGLLIILWASLTIAFIGNQDLGLYSLDTRFKYGDFKETPQHKEIARGDVVSAEFIYPDPYLNRIGIRFNGQEEITNDKYEFRIKDITSDKWYSVAQFPQDQFPANQLFYFQFDPIKDSKGKKFLFELESLSAATSSAVSLSIQYPSFVARSDFNSKIVYKNEKIIPYFIFRKIINLFSFSSFTPHFLSYSLPLVVYVYFLIFGLTFHLPIFLFFILLFFDTFFVTNRYDVLSMSIILAWLLPAIRFRIDGRVSLFFALICTVIFPVFFSLGIYNISEKFATSAYLFFTLGLIQLGYFVLFNIRNAISLKEFVTSSRKATWILYLMIIGEITMTVKSITNKEDLVTTYKDDAALVLKFLRMGEPLAESYIYVSKMVRLLILVIVHLIRLAIKYGPYLLFMLFLRLQITNLHRFYRFYMEFFVANQITLYWHQAGNSFIRLFAVLSVILLIASVILYFKKKLNLRTLTILLVIILFTSLKISQHIFDAASSPYRSGTVVWTVRPSETAEPWVDVNIVGRNFKNLPFYGKVLINGVEQRIMKWSDQEIVFRTNPTVTRSGDLEIETYDGNKIESIYFKYEGNR